MIPIPMDLEQSVQVATAVVKLIGTAASAAKGTIDSVSALWERLSGKAKANAQQGNDELDQTLALIEKKPTSQSYQSALIEALATVLKDDPTFAAEVVELIKSDSSLDFAGRIDVTSVDTDVVKGAHITDTKSVRFKAGSQINLNTRGGRSATGLQVGGNSDEH